MCVVIGIFVIGREKYAYPTKVEKLNFNVSKCGTLAQSKAKRGAKKVKINYEKYSPTGKYILTDDKAPVELLGMKVVDRMISDELSYYKEIFKKEGLKGLLSSF